MSWSTCCVSVCLDDVNQIVTAAHRDLWSCVHRPTNEPWSHARNQVSLTYFTGQNPEKHAKVGVNKPAECHSLLVIVLDCKFLLMMTLTQRQWSDRSNIFNRTHSWELRWRPLPPSCYRTPPRWRAMTSSSRACPDVSATTPCMRMDIWQQRLIDRRSVRHISKINLSTVSRYTHDIAIVILSVCPSVCLSHWWSTPRQFNHHQHHWELIRRPLQGLSGASNYLRGGGPKTFYGGFLPWFTLYRVAKFGWVLLSEMRVWSPTMKKNAEFSEGGWKRRSYFRR